MATALDKELIHYFSTIKNGNALRIDWQSLIEPLPWEKEEPRYHYIFGNPPFVGKHLQNAEQKKDMDLIFTNVKGAGVLDYVTAWYIKAAQYLMKANEGDFCFWQILFFPQNTYLFTLGNGIGAYKVNQKFWCMSPQVSLPGTSLLSQFSKL